MKARRTAGGWRGISQPSAARAQPWPGLVPVPGREVAGDEAAQSPLARRRVLEHGLAGAAGQGLGERLRREPLLGAELAVKAAMGHAGSLAQRVHADAGQASFAEQPGGRGEDPRPVLGGLLLRDPHPIPSGSDPLEARLTD